MRRCHFCGKILHEIPFTCRHCKKIFCSDHHLPENHHCHHQPHDQHQKKYYEIPSNKTPITKPPNNYGKLFKEYFNLKNFTIISILLLLVGILPSLFSLHNYQKIFQFAFEIGAICFVLAYFLYAMKCWGATSKICAVLMITMPLVIYSLSTTKISDSTINILFYVVIQFCIYAIVSIILLYLTEQVKLIIEGYVFKRTRRLHWYFTPKLSYSVVGVLIVSFLAVNYGGVALFSDNAASITQSLQNFNTPSTANLYATTPIPFQTPQIIPQTQRSTIIPTTTPKLDFKQFPKTTSYYYVINGDRRSIGFTTYGVLSDYLSKESHSYYNDMEKEVIMELLENNYQNESLQPLLETITKSSSNPNDQARIAISLVQHIPYNWNKYYGTSMDWYYPYETLYNNIGVCSDKSLLLAYLLNGLGFDTVLFEFSDHMAVGIKSSPTYDFYDTGYAFIETTRPTIITYVPDTYLSGFRVSPNPHIIHLNGGKKVLDVSTEYRDAIKMKQLEGMGEVLDQSHYAEWLTLTNNYDLQYST
jgi:hypothetical protein